LPPKRKKKHLKLCRTATVLTIPTLPFPPTAVRETIAVIVEMLASNEPSPNGTAAPGDRTSVHVGDEGGEVVCEDCIHAVNLSESGLKS
jgi:hypothetical protein